MKTTRGWVGIGLVAAGIAHGGAEPARKIVIGLVAKSQSNPVFQAAYAGARDAARELGT